MAREYGEEMKVKRCEVVIEGTVGGQFWLFEIRTLQSLISLMDTFSRASLIQLEKTPIYWMMKHGRCEGVETGGRGVGGDCKQKGA